MTVDWIRKALIETGKTRSGLAKALGRSPSAVTDLLNGSRRLRADEIAIAVEYLGVEPPRLVGGGRARGGDRADAPRSRASLSPAPCRRSGVFACRSHSSHSLQAFPRTYRVHVMFP